MPQMIETIKTTTKSGYSAEITTVNLTEGRAVFGGYYYEKKIPIETSWDESGKALGENEDPFFSIDPYVLKDYIVKRD